MKQKEFISIFLAQTEPALCILSDEDLRHDFDGFRHIEGSFVAVGDALLEGGNLAVMLTQDFSRELYSVIKQYTERRGMLQIPVRGKWAQFEIDTHKTHLLLLVTPSVLANIEKEYPLRQIVGMVCNGTITE